MRGESKQAMGTFWLENSCPNQEAPTLLLQGIAIRWTLCLQHVSIICGDTCKHTCTLEGERRLGTCFKLMQSSASQGFLVELLS